MQPSYWQNYPSATHYKGWEHEPIPGWGVRPVMAGPRMVGVGSAPSATHAQSCPPGTWFNPMPHLWGGPPIGCVPVRKRHSLSGDIPDVAFLCAAQQQLYQAARKLYPGNDAQQTAYILANGAGFTGDWQAWCAQRPDVGTPGTTIAAETSGMLGTMPWWIWVAVPVVLGGGYALAREMGWLGK